MNGWEIAWKLWMVASTVVAFAIWQRKIAASMFFGLIGWVREGLEDADGQFNAKDIWMTIFSTVLIIMIFMDFHVRGQFSTHSWIIIDCLVTGGALTKFIESSQFTKVQEFFKKTK